MVQECNGSQDFYDHTGSPYSTGLALGDFFLFLTIKKQLAGKTLTQESFKSMWEGPTRSTVEEDFATTFRELYGRGEKCLHSGEYNEKKID
jgi:hypothetical protein